MASPIKLKGNLIPLKNLMCIKYINKNMSHCIYLACLLQVTKETLSNVGYIQTWSLFIPRSFGVLLPRSFWMGQGQIVFPYLSGMVFKWIGMCFFSNPFWNIQCVGGAPRFEVLLNFFGLMGNMWDISQYYHSHLFICDPRWQSWGNSTDQLCFSRFLASGNSSVERTL